MNICKKALEFFHLLYLRPPRHFHLSHPPQAPPLPPEAARRAAAALRSSLLPPLCRRTPPHGGGHGMAEVAAARRPLLPPSSSSSLLPPPHRARPISLLARATPQPARGRGRGREPRGSFGPPRRPSLLRCGFLRASPSLLRRGFLRAATTSGGGTLSPLPRRRSSLPPPSYSLPELERIWASPRLLAEARADRHARFLAAPAVLAARAVPASRAMAIWPALPAVPSGSRTGPAPTAEVGTAVERRDATAGSRAVARGGGATAGGDDSPEEERNSER